MRLTQTIRLSFHIYCLLLNRETNEFMPSRVLSLQKCDDCEPVEKENERWAILQARKAGTEKEALYLDN